MVAKFNTSLAAQQECDKRNRVKSKHLSSKTWRPVEEDGGFNVKLEDTMSGMTTRSKHSHPTGLDPLLLNKMLVAQLVLDGMDPDTRVAYQALAKAALLARCDATIKAYEAVHGPQDRRR